MDFEIVPCNGQAYLEKAVQLVVEYDISQFGSDGTLGWAQAKRHAECIVKAEGSYIARVGGDTIGVVSGGADNDQLHYGYLLFLYVKPNCRGKGVGTALLQELEQYFEEKECRHIKICVSPGEEALLPFLEKRGYYQSYTAMKKRIHKSDGE